jgi:hypothetical protein
MLPPTAYAGLIRTVHIRLCVLEDMKKLAFRLLRPRRKKAHDMVLTIGR